MKKMTRVLVVIGIISVAGWYILETLLIGGGLSGGLSYREFQLQTFLSPTKQIAEYACTGDYKWRITEEDQVDAGNWFELGTGPSIFFYRKLQLVSSQRITAELVTNHSDNEPYANSFPTGRPYLKAFVYGTSAMKTTANHDPELRWALSIPSARISAADFDQVAKCLRDNLTKVEQKLGEVAQHPHPFGWLLRIDDSLRLDAYSQAPVFECGDGTRAITWDQYLRMVNADEINQTIGFRPPHTVGVIGPNGNLYKDIGPWVDTTVEQVEVPDKICTNSEGITLQAYLASVPSRIQILAR